MLTEGIRLRRLCSTAEVLAVVIHVPFEITLVCWLFLNATEGVMITFIECFGGHAYVIAEMPLVWVFVS